MKNEKVISTKISPTAYDLLQGHARNHYFEKKITQPTISELVRNIINEWLETTAIKAKTEGGNEIKPEPNEIQQTEQDGSSFQSALKLINKPVFETPPKK